VLAKFFSALAFLALTLALSFSLPLTAGWLGPVDWGVVTAGYLGALFLGAAYLSLGVFISSLTKNQIIAFILALAACFSIFIVGEDFVAAGLLNSLATLARFVGLGQRFNNIARGVLDTRDFIFYASFSFLFLWLNAKALAARKW
jgi:ABC-2 type transport system permease protein